MKRLIDALSWTGIGATLIMFAVFADSDLPALRASTAQPQPESVSTFLLEDPGRNLGGWFVGEYDLVFPTVPDNLEELLMRWMQAGLDEGARTVWFAYEGSFHFEHLLTSEIADQVYAAGDAKHLAVALDDDYRQSEGWARKLGEVRAGLV
jgi:hypothetical protein